MDRYKYTEVLQEDGTYSTPMPIKVNAENVIFEDNDTVVVKLNQKAIKEIYGEKNITFSDGTPLDESQEYFIILNGNNDIANVGVSLLIGGEENTISGDCLIVMGSSNIVEGNCDNVYGDNNEIKGNNNIVHGDNNIIEGNNNIIFNENNIVKSNNVTNLTGSNNQIIKDNVTVIGDNHFISAKDSTIIGKGTEEEISTYLKAVTNGEKIIYGLRPYGEVFFDGKITANKFNGKAIQDINNNYIINYIKDLSFMEQGGIIFIDGNGKLTRIEREKWNYYPSLFCGHNTINKIEIDENSPEALLDTIKFYNSIEEVNSMIFYFAEIEVEALTDEKSIIKYDIRLNDKTVENFGIPARVLTKGKHIINIICPLYDIQYVKSDRDKDVIYTLTLRMKCTKGKVVINQDEFCSLVQGSNIKEQEV